MVYYNTKLLVFYIIAIVGLYILLALSQILRHVK